MTRLYPFPFLVVNGGTIYPYLVFVSDVRT
jgi:hypothetical protein